eukprot:CAMPEP_0117663366 /NCGR_PEP_ID=MMETSP0804-20121206/8565_1 /TAXON_ID=1074897 /ORGANISM="Tetraselmis astigmatica, Strain CCMP880" /LENGTH=210 /DNA_ID=CAMNT_0005470361 /DNA_START=138 /DNA_END=770 /DNA_ORIENTATION=+
MAAASPLSKRGGNSTKPAGKRKGKPGAADRSIKPGGSRGVNKHGKKRGSFNADRQKGSRPSKQGRTDNSGPQTQAEASSAASAAAPKLPMGESTAAGRKAVLAARQSKKSTMLKAAEYKALREQSAVISTAGLEEQAEWLWQHHSLASGASSLERGGFSGQKLCVELRVHACDHGGHSPKNKNGHSVFVPGEGRGEGGCLSATLPHPLST